MMSRYDDERPDRRVDWIARSLLFFGILVAIGGAIGFFVTWNAASLVLVPVGVIDAMYWDTVRERFEQRRAPRNEDYNQPW
jgi:membrane protein implicated in regulation of membrane protease activity